LGTSVEPLVLGRHGRYGQQIQMFKRPILANGSNVVDLLKQKGVLGPPSKQSHALNIARGWDPYITTILVLMPVVLSLVMSILWSIIATQRYHQDAQASTQTGFTIGSYVVTAGTSFRRSEGLETP
jgi:hypothetical protein